MQGLSYSLLRDVGGEAIGWRLRLMDNAPGREEYLFLAPGKEFSLGASSQDQIAFSATGLKVGHLRIRREGSRLWLVPSKHPVLLDGAALEEEQCVESSARLQLGEQVVWCFPPTQA